MRAELVEREGTMRVLGRVRCADPRRVPGSVARAARTGWLRGACVPAASSRGARVLLLAVLLAGVTGLGTAAPSAAAQPTNLRGQVTDDAGVLSSADRTRVTAALDDLLRRTGTQLWVWYTDTTGDLTAPDFAARTAQLSSLGGTDLLLVIAVADRAYGYSRPEAFPLSDTDLQRLLSSDLEPGLRAGDYPGAVIAFADGLASRTGGDAGGGSGGAAGAPSAGGGGSAPGPGSSGGGGSAPS